MEERKVIAKKVVSFGKIDANGCGRRINAAEVEIRMYQDGEKLELAICGDVWNSRHTDIIMGGQCLDEMAEYLPKNREFKKIYRWWKLYHLNGMHAGTEEQDECLLGCDSYDYTERCSFLQAEGLYEVEVDGEPYEYGHAWLYRPIPEPDLSEIKAYLGIKEA